MYQSTIQDEDMAPSARLLLDRDRRSPTWQAVRLLEALYRSAPVWLVPGGQLQV